MYSQRIIATDGQWPLFLFCKNLERLETTYGKHVAASAIWYHSIIVVVAGIVAVRATMEQLQIMHIHRILIIRRAIFKNIILNCDNRVQMLGYTRLTSRMNLDIVCLRCEMSCSWSPTECTRPCRFRGKRVVCEHPARMIIKTPNGV